MSAVIREAQTSRPVAQFLDAPKKLLIDGKWVPAASGKTFEVKNPATGATIARAAEGDKADIDAAVRAARRAFESGPWASHDTVRARQAGMADRRPHLEVHRGARGARVARQRQAAWRSRRRRTCRSRPTSSSTWPAGAPRSRARPFRCRCSIRPARSITPTRGPSRSASSGRSFPGTSRCSWPPGSSRRRSRPAAPWC